MDLYKIIARKWKNGVKLHKNEIFFLHPIFFSRDRYEKWTSHYWFYKCRYRDFVGALMIEALISINENFTVFSFVNI